MANIFQSVAVNRIGKSLFNLSHWRKFSCNMGLLYPIQVTEVLPNETFRIKHEMLAKFSPLLAPMMQEVDMYVEDFYVPLRLTWQNWEKFITPSDDGTYPAKPYFDYSTASNFAVGSLADFLGLPTVESAPTTAEPVDSLFFRAYQLIWNSFYRDQNLQPEIDINFEVDGQEVSPSSRGLFTLRRRCWPKDYFTSALPTTQRGGDVHLPMSGNAPVTLYENSNDTHYPLTAVASGSSSPRPVNLTTAAPNGQGDSLRVDLSQVTAATINELRRATALQEYLELNMRVGGRYNEFIYGNFGKHVPDYRIDRPQFLGGYRKPLVVNQINQTSSTDSAGPLADMAGQAFGLGSSRGVKYQSYEHGIIISLFSVLPKATYQQGLPRKFQRFDPLDYANPKFGNLGEQAILNKEVFAQHASPNGIFGYTPRYAEYKYEPSTVHGEFKTTLNYWHMGRIFQSDPQLNSSFVQATPAERPFAVITGNDKLRVEVYNRVKAVRPLPYYGTPKLI